VDGHLFSMEATEVIVPAFGDGHTVLHQHASHGRVWADAALTAFGDLEGPPHEFRLAF
jgi:hypothetical protein